MNFLFLKLNVQPIDLLTHLTKVRATSNLSNCVLSKINKYLKVRK